MMNVSPIAVHNTTICTDQSAMNTNISLVQFSLVYYDTYNCSKYTVSVRWAGSGGGVGVNDSDYPYID